MKELQNAIYNKVIAIPHNPFYTAISGRCYFNYAPQESAFPYVVFYIINDRYDYQFTSDFENILLQFSIFSSKSDTAELNDIFTKLKSLFDWANLNVTGYTVVSMTREFAIPDWIPVEKIWQYVVQYRVLLEKN